jgi:hypothetical protein
MSGIFIIELITALVIFLLPVFRFLGNIICLPQLVLKPMKLNILYYQRIDNILKLITHLLFLLIYNAIHLNIHFLYIAYYCFSITSPFQLVISYLIFFTITTIIYRVNDFRYFIFRDFLDFLFYSNYLIIYMLVIFIYCFNFRNRDIIDFLYFGRYFVLSEIYYICFLGYGYAILNILTLICCCLHVLTPLAWIRLWNFYNDSTFSSEDYVLIFQSTIYMFVDLALILAYIFNMLFVRSFITSHYKLFVDGLYAYEPKAGEYLYTYTVRLRLFHYIKNEIILTNFYKNVTFIITALKICFAVVVTVGNLVFIWRIGTTLTALKNFIKNGNLYEFLLDFTLNFFDGLIDIFSPIIILFNHINIFNYGTVKKLNDHYSRLWEGKSKKPSYAHINIMVYVHKNFDYLATVFSFIRIFDFTTFVILLRSYKQGKFTIWKVFPLLSETENFIKHGIKDKEEKPKHNVYLSNMETFFNDRRNRLISLSLKSIVNIALGIICLCSLADPYQGLHYLVTLVIFARSPTDNLAISVDYLITKYMNICVIIIKNMFVDLLLLSLNLTMCLLAPWTIPFFVKFIYQQALLNPIKMLKDKHFSLFVKTEKEENEKNDFTQKQTKYFIKGWLFIIFMTLTHLSVFRAITLWKEFKSLKFNKKTGHYNFTRAFSDTIELTNKEKKLSAFKIILLNNAKMAIREIIFYPFLLIIYILAPWNISSIKDFFRERKIFYKLVYTVKLFKTYLEDLLTIVQIILHLCSFINTFKTIRLIYYAYKANRCEEWKIKYDVLFKYPFKVQVRHLSNGTGKKMLAIVLIIINIFLVTRIFDLYRRVRRFINIRSWLFTEYETLRRFINPKTQQFEKNKLETVSRVDLCCICEFLSPFDIQKLYQSRSLNNKLNSNLIWKNMFENYYIRKQKINTIYPENFADYKTACHEASKLAQKKTLTEEERDKQLGIYYVVLEETVESLLKLPHLMLMPVKLVSYAIKFIRDNYTKVYQKFLESNFHENYLRDFFLTFTPIQINQLFLESQSLFFDIQIYGLVSLFELIMHFIFGLINAVVIPYVFLIKIICLEPIRINAIARFDVPWRRPYQNFISVIFLALHVSFMLLPFLYFHSEGLINVFAKHIISSPFDPLSYFYFIEEAFNIWYYKGFFGRIFYLFGPYCLNVIFYGINLLIVRIFVYIFRNTEVSIYDNIYYIFAPTGLLEDILRRYRLIINYGLFPHIQLLSKICRISDNILIRIFVNIFCAVFIFYPYYLIYRLWSDLTNFQLLLLLTYSIINVRNMTTKLESERIRRGF